MRGCLFSISSTHRPPGVQTSPLNNLCRLRLNRASGRKNCPARIFLIISSAEDIGQFALEKDGIRFRIETTLDIDLQKYIDRLLRHSRTLQAAVVVLDPFDGRILAMTSRDTNGNGDNLCLKAEFPAASLIKIISTAAALEKAGYTPDKSLFYEGSKHTLYRFQLRESIGAHRARTNLRKAFATSNNSVFGKIGIYALGQEVIDEYAEKFFFNR
ncbi:MAG: penicillin-binding transpeptidase domain-containing protein, partial [Planctomycetota bacterium]